MRIPRFLPAFFFIALWPACNDSPTDTIPDGVFDFTSFDTTGVALAHGWFTLVIADSDSVYGEWHFRPVGNPQHIGPQTGDGNLLGGFSQGKLWVDLHPGFIDNNLILMGVLDGNRYEGQWMWISFSGVTNRGTFQAARQ